MLLEQYMTPVNIIIAVILVVLGYLAYKKYQKNNNSYEHAVSSGKIPAEYILSEVRTEDIDLTSQLVSIKNKFNTNGYDYNNTKLLFDINLNFNLNENKIQISGNIILPSSLNIKDYWGGYWVNKKNERNYAKYKNFKGAFGFIIKSEKYYIQKIYYNLKDGGTINDIDITSEIDNIKRIINNLNISTSPQRYFGLKIKKDTTVDYINESLILTLPVDQYSISNIGKPANVFTLARKNATTYTNINLLRNDVCLKCKLCLECPPSTPCPKCLQESPPQDSPNTNPDDEQDSISYPTNV
jgi:hypothetical protein